MRKQDLLYFLKMGQIRPLFVYFRSFRMANIEQNEYNDKSIDDELVTRTRGGRMEGADESTELCSLCINISISAR